MEFTLELADLGNIAVLKMILSVSVGWLMYFMHTLSKKQKGKDAFDSIAARLVFLLLPALIWVIWFGLPNSST